MMSGAYFVVTVVLIVGIILSSTSRRRENLKGVARLFMQRSPEGVNSGDNPLGS